MKQNPSLTFTKTGRPNVIPVTVVVLTFNEEDQIESLAANLDMHFDDIHVVDSASTDGTIALAKNAGWPVYTKGFTGFGDQRNWAIDNIPHRYEWVLHLDADERLTDDFLSELRRTCERNPPEAGFYVPNKLMLGGRWLRYASGYPVYQVRLFHRARLRFENQGHGQREVTSGTLGYFRQPYLHFAFSKGIEAWMKKHARYAAREVEAISAAGREANGLLAQVRDALTFDPIRRRRALKRLSLRLPARPFMRLMHTLVLKRGILDGRAGITYAKMMAAYEAMFVALLAAKRLELEATSKAGERGG